MADRTCRSCKSVLTYLLVGNWLCRSARNSIKRSQYLMLSRYPMSASARKLERVVPTLFIRLGIEHVEKANHEGK
jgi:hypothetical protein